MSSPHIQLALWLLQPLLQACVVSVMFRLRLHKKFPVFFTFALTQIAIFAVQFPVYQWGSRDAYFYAFWIPMSLNLVIEFKIIHEVFLDIFRPYHALKDLGTALFKWAALIMILVSVVMISISPGWDDPVVKTVLIAHRCVRVIQCGMILFLLAFSTPLGFSWKRLSFGIAMGFGILAAMELLTNALYSGTHISLNVVNVLNMTAYNSGVSIWLLYSWLNSRDYRVPVLVPQRWDEALMDIHAQNESESLIPMFEHMVDRAFSKTNDGHA
jgi:energy-converting hydrogenase Eha subunit E